MLSLTESDEVVALVETVEIHIDMCLRKSTEISDEIFDTMLSMQKEHEPSSNYPFEKKLKIK